MKKVALIMVALSLFMITGCGKEEDSKNNNQEQEVVNTDPYKEFKERTKAINDLNEELLKSGLYGEVTVNEYDAGFQLTKKMLSKIFLKRDTNKYWIEISTLNATSFDKSQIDEAIKEIEDNKQSSAKLGNYVIYKTMPSKLKQRLDELKAKNVVGAESEMFANYSNDTWLDKNGIPIYIQSATEADSIFVLKNVDSAEPNRYYMFRVITAGQDGLYSITDSSNVTKLEVELEPTDMLNILKYEYSNNNMSLKENQKTTIKEFFDQQDKTTNEVDMHTNNIEVKDNAISIVIYN